MRVVNQQVPTPFRDVDRGSLMRPNVLEFAQSMALMPLRLAGHRARLPDQPALSSSIIDIAVRLAEGLPSGLYDGRRSRSTSRTCSATPTAPTTSGCWRTSSTSRPPTSTPASGSCSAGRTGTTCRSPAPSAASTALPDGLQAGRDQGPPPDRRRHPLDHQRRHRGRARRQVRDRGQPAGALRERLPEGHPHHARQPRAPGGRHGLPPDRLPDLQAARPPAPARGGAPLAGEVPGRGHHPDRARPQRRADVRDEHHELHQARGHRPPRVRVGHAQAGRGLRRLQRGLRASTASRSRPRACARWSERSRKSARSTAAWRRILEQTTGALLRQSEEA